MKLYELTNSFNDVQELLEDGNLDNEMLATTLESIDLEIEVKADNIAALIKELDGNIATLLKEKDRIDKLAKSYKANQDFLKNYLKDNLTKVGKPKIKTDRFRITVSDRKPKLVLNDELIPEQYKLQEVIYKVDKEKIENDINSNIKIAGVTLEPVKAITIS